MQSMVDQLIIVTNKWDLYRAGLTIWLTNTIIMSHDTQLSNTHIMKPLL